MSYKIPKALSVSFIGLGLLFIVIALISQAALAKELKSSNHNLAIPLSEGSYWLYEGKETLWQKNQEVVKNIKKKTVVLKSVIVRGATVALLDNFPLAGEGRSTILQSGNKYYLLLEDDFDKIRQGAKLSDYQQAENLIIDMSLGAGYKFGCITKDAEQRADGMYCTKIISSSHRESVFKLETLPDSTTFIIKPRAGVTKYVYQHNGSVDETTLILKDYKIK